MKKSILNFVTVIALSGALLTSCSNDDDNKNNNQLHLLLQILLTFKEKSLMAK